MTPPRNRASGHVRIIGGQWRGRKLPVLDSQGLRPTTDRTKETLFNWLMHDINGARCLDAFAGSGSLGIEALSRGAEQVVFIESDAKAAQQIKSNCALLGVNTQVHTEDAMRQLERFETPFDGVFVDPPFQLGLVVPLIEGLLQRNLLKAKGWLYVEHEASLNLPVFKGLRLHRQKKAGQFCYALYYYD